MNRRTFLSQTLGVSLGAKSVRRPNIIVVMMDDFGVGHCGPYAEHLKTSHFDPAFVDFLKRREIAYAPEEALDCAQRAMPRLSKIAREGVLFTNAFAPSNLCAPSRTGVLTGRLQNRFGHYQNIDVEASGLPKDAALARHLKSEGYATAFIGKWHAGTRDESLRGAVLAKHGLTPPEYVRLTGERKAAVEKEIRQTGYLGAVLREHNPLNHGFDYYFGYNRWECPFYDSEHIWENWTYTGLQPRYNTHLFTDKAIEFMNGARREGKPFFVEICFHAVHGPLKPKAPDRNFDRFPSRSYDLTNFYAHVNAVDEALEAIRTSLGEAWDDTLLVFCADNGAPVDVATPLPGNAPFAGHKGTFLQGGIRVPLIVRWPAGFKGGQRRTELASLLDIMPTALDAAGVKAPQGLDGASLLPLVRGEAARVREHLVWAGIHARAWGFTRETVVGNAEQRREESPGAWVITDGRYLLRFVTRTPPGLFREAPEGAPPRYELYDIREDPQEKHNLYTIIPETARRLEATYRTAARKWPPPARWRRDRWQELTGSGEEGVRQKPGR